MHESPSLATAAALSRSPLPTQAVSEIVTRFSFPFAARHARSLSTTRHSPRTSIPPAACAPCPPTQRYPTLPSPPARIIGWAPRHRSLVPGRTHCGTMHTQPPLPGPSILPRLPGREVIQKKKKKKKVEADAGAAKTNTPETILHKVEEPIHDNIRELVTWECKEHGVKSWMC
jgi:hypothetical protein